MKACSLVHDVYVKCDMNVSDELTASPMGILHGALGADLSDHRQEAVSA